MVFLVSNVLLLMATVSKALMFGFTASMDAYEMVRVDMVGVLRLQQLSTMFVLASLQVVGVTEDP